MLDQALAGSATAPSRRASQKDTVAGPKEDQEKRCVFMALS
jgi:hypothetical protein